MIIIQNNGFNISVSYYICYQLTKKRGSLGSEPLFWLSVICGVLQGVLRIDLL